MDATHLLEADHERVERLFAKFEDSPPGDHDGLRALAEQFTRELSIHSAVEEQIFYPFVREQLPALEGMILEDLEEHHAVKTLLAELERTSAGRDRFRAKAMVIIENVRHHIEEEEIELFPKVRNAFGRPALDDLGDALARAKDFAPTHPHPHAPDEPPANLLTGPVASILDDARDKLRALAS